MTPSRGRSCGETPLGSFGYLSANRRRARFISGADAVLSSRSTRRAAARPRSRTPRAPGSRLRAGCPPRAHRAPGPIAPSWPGPRNPSRRCRCRSNPGRCGDVPGSTASSRAACGGHGRPPTPADPCRVSGRPRRPPRSTRSRRDRRGRRDRGRTPASGPLRGGNAVIGDRAAGSDRGGLIVGRAGDGFDTDFDALLDAALQRFRLLDSADELGCLVEHQILCDVDKPLKRLPRRSHVFEHRGPRVLAIVSRRPCLDTLETHEGPRSGALRSDHPDLYQEIPISSLADQTFTAPAQIRNFSIIAHIDHGKSTLADRMLQLTGVVDERSMRAQYLDRMDIERERGITIKAQNVRLPWKVNDVDYVLHLIDTPGHVDFTYEVSRALEACEGAVLLVDAAQGIEAQTLANLYLALDRDLHIIPVLNKIDLPAADPDRYAAEIAHIIGCEPGDVLRVSGKTGDGVADLLDHVVREVPPPQGDADAPTRAMIFDSVYDIYRGVVTYVRVVDGKILP